MEDIQEPRTTGLSISAISQMTGYHRKTIRRRLAEWVFHAYRPRQPRPSILGSFKPYIDERLRVGVWNAVVNCGSAVRVAATAL